jgi:hypothetical protein
MSEEMAQAVREYVAGGGKVLFTGAAMYERFDAAFWGARVVETETEATHFVPAADGSFAAWSKTWHRLQPRGGKALGRLGKTLLTDADLLPHPAAVLNGAGTVAYVPWDLFRFYRETRYPLARAFVGELVAALGPELGMRVSAPVGVDIIRRKKGREEFIHLINRTSSPPTEPPATAVEEIPPVGPVELEIACAAPPSRVSLAGEKGDLEWGWAKGTLYVTVPQVEIHAAVRVKE